MGVTALNVYAGLVGPLLITDQRERAMQISGVMPSGQYDVPLVLKDYWSEQKNSQTAKGIHWTTATRDHCAPVTRTPELAHLATWAVAGRRAEIDCALGWRCVRADHSLISSARWLCTDR